MPDQNPYKVLSRINAAIAFAKSIDPLGKSAKVQTAIYAYRQCHKFVREEFGITPKETEEVLNGRAGGVSQ